MPFSISKSRWEVCPNLSPCLPFPKDACSQTCTRMYAYTLRARSSEGCTGQGSDLQRDFDHRRWREVFCIAHSSVRLLSWLRSKLCYNFEVPILRSPPSASVSTDRDQWSPSSMRLSDSAALSTFTCVSCSLCSSTACINPADLADRWARGPVDTLDENVRCVL